MTGPSFKRLTSILAPKTPVCTDTPFAQKVSIQYSYTLQPVSAGAAAENAGLFSLKRSAAKVHLLTKSTSPPLSCDARFTLSLSSLNMRIFTIFDTIFLQIQACFPILCIEKPADLGRSG